MMNKEALKSSLKRLWRFIWHEDSLASWIVNIILAFILIKFIVYPLLGALLGTAFPIVAVVSPSMEHSSGNFDTWWASNGKWYEDQKISKEQFSEFIFKRGFNKGDIIFLRKANPETVEVGDVIVFRSHSSKPRPDPIIHRVVKVWETDQSHFQTKGDNNDGVINQCNGDCLDETDIQESQLLGKAVFRIPFLGWIKIIFVDIVARPYCSVTNNFWPC